MSLPFVMESSFESYMEDKGDELLVEFISTRRREEYNWWLRDQGLYTEAPNDYEDDPETISRFLTDVPVLSSEYSRFAREAWMNQEGY